MLIRVVIKNMNILLRRKFDDNKIDKFIRKNSSPKIISFHLFLLKKNGFFFLDEIKLCSIQKKFGEIGLSREYMQDISKRTIDFDEIR